MSTDYDTRYPTLRFDRPADGVLRITLDGPGLNSVSPAGHRELAVTGPITFEVDPGAYRHLQLAIALPDLAWSLHDQRG